MNKTMIYVLDSDYIDSNPDFISDDEFIKIAEKHGKAYSLKEFENAFNKEIINTNLDYIKCIEDSKIKIYRIYDGDYSEIVGIRELCEFAEREITSNPDDYLAENLEELNSEEIKKIRKIVDAVVIGKDIKTVEEAELILKIRYYKVEEIELY